MAQMGKKISLSVYIFSVVYFQV